jgi:hypothetical protein
VNQQPPENNATDEMSQSLTLVEAQIRDMMPGVDADHAALSRLLDQLYADGADEQKLNLVQDFANSLAKTASALNAATASAFEAIRVIRSQSRLLQEALTDYRAAVQRGDLDISEIRILYDDAYNDAEASLEDALHERITDMVWNHTGLSYSQSSSLTRMITGCSRIDRDHAIWLDLIDWLESAEEHEAY